MHNHQLHFDATEQRLDALYQERLALAVQASTPTARVWYLAAADRAMEQAWRNAWNKANKVLFAQRRQELWAAIRAPAAVGDATRE